MYLDYHAETRGITRAAAEKAARTLRFAAADKVTAACPIEKGHGVHDGGGRAL